MITSQTDRHADALIGEIGAAAETDAGRILAEAKAQADAIVAEAHRAARARMRDAVAKLRRHAAREMLLTRARLETERRQTRQSAELAAISDGLPIVRAALLDLWRTPEGRRDWCLAVLQVACIRLTPQRWWVDLPEAGPPDDDEDIGFAIQLRTGVKPEFRFDAALGAGIRIAADDAVLDGTLDAVLADREQISALLLGEMKTGAERGEA